MAKKITQKVKTPMPLVDPDVRRHSFGEVATGYSVELARQEASRCIECKNMPCVAGCPVEIDIPTFVRQVASGDFDGAFQTLSAKNLLPAVCGRVCPQEDQCEKLCTLGVRFEPVAIGRLERFVADYASACHLPVTCLSPTSHVTGTGRKVAIVGSGPAGLTAAADLAKLGHSVTIFEALHKPGGVLMYGIPEFRLPKTIVESEIDKLTGLGVDIKTNHVIGRMFTIDELFNELGFDALFIGTGAGLPHFPSIPGVNLIGVYSANEYLTRSNLMKAYRFPEHDTPIVRGKNVAVIGGGNTAMDSVRTALRLGAEHAYLIYRRSRDEMPARAEEVEHAEEEGVEIVLLAAPTELLGNEKSRVRAMRCVRMALGEPDASGRRSPVPIAGSEFELEVDTVVFAVGQGANPLIRSTTPDLPVTKWGYIVADPATGATQKPGVFAGGDIVTGGATVISAMGAGRRAARAIDAYLHRLPARGHVAADVFIST
ncbi:MAG: NADPH-dependent glutamate synthase [Acidobacteria bacterium]|nr:NADPH-dependent glutamate synthase [Acidobacteriota bacterium]